MKLERINAWLTLAGNVAILVGLVALAIEIRGNTTALRIQVMDNAAAAAGERQLLTATSPELRDLYVKALFNPEELTLADAWGVSAYFNHRLDLIQTQYFRYTDGATTRADWEDIKLQATYVFGTATGQKYWNAVRADYSYIPEFVAAIDAELTRSDLVPNDQWLLEFHENLTVSD